VAHRPATLWVGEVEANTTTVEESVAPPAEVRGAAYVRMSTDMQQYSIANQMQGIAEYASTRGITVVRIYSDEGRSGLTLKHRDALQALLNDVQSGQADYTEILVYDITRWGRFQDPDESAAHERTCKQAGVRVHYCAEPFVNDGTPLSGMVKHLKRAMAGEYSRELSTKVRSGLIRLAHQGYRLSGAAGYGLRRASISADGQVRRTLLPGERKAAYTDHLTLVPGPDEEVQVVRDIFRMYVDEQLSIIKVAHRLNERGIPWQDGTPWDRQRVHSLLSNEKYTGTLVFGRTRQDMEGHVIYTAPATWIRYENAFEPLVDRDLFLAARARLNGYQKQATDEELLDALRALLHEHHYLNSRLINSAYPLNCSVPVYIRRFGSLLNAYDLIGYIPVKITERQSERKRVQRFIPECFRQTLAALEGAGVEVEALEVNRLFRMNGELTVGFECCRPQLAKVRTLAWQVHYDELAAPDLHLVVRLAHRITRVQDYFLLPRAVVSNHSGYLFRRNRPLVDAYRYEDLQPLVAMGRRIPITEP